MKNDAQTQSDLKGLIELMKDYNLHLMEGYLLHHKTCDTLNNEELRIGIPMIALSGIATLTLALLPTLQSILPTAEWLKWLPVLAIVCSGSSSVLASLITFLHLGAKAVRHHNAASNYYLLLNRCKTYLADPEGQKLSFQVWRERVREVLEQAHSLHKDSPQVPGRVYKKAGETVRNYQQVKGQMYKLFKGFPATSDNAG